MQPQILHISIHIPSGLELTRPVAARGSILLAELVAILMVLELAVSKNIPVGSESPCRAADTHSLFFQYHHLWRFYKHKYFQKSSHRLKALSGTLIIIVNSYNLDLIDTSLLKVNQNDYK